MHIGYGIGTIDLTDLGFEPKKDQGFFIFPEIGEGHSRACMMDDLQVGLNR